jgi:hypothetical protein
MSPQDRVNAALQHHLLQRQPYHVRYPDITTHCGPSPFSTRAKANIL